MSSPPKTLCLVDAHSQIYRAFYAIRNLTAPDGRPTNAVYGLTTILLKILRERKPDAIAVVFDARGPTFREKKFAAYKAQRPSMPEELSSQMPLIKDVVDAMGLPRFEQQGYEADDLIGTLAVRAAADGFAVTIVSGDKDLRQLLRPGIVIYDAGKDRVLDESWLMAETGLKPDQVRDLLALAGDTSDNVPGVPGIGPKTALELVKEWGSVENLLANLDRVKGHKRLDNIKAHRELLVQCKELVTLDTNSPVEWSPEALKPRPPDNNKLAALFSDLGFRKLASELAVGTPAADTAAAAIVKGRYRTLTAAKDIRAFVAEAAKAPAVALVVHGTGNGPQAGEISGAAISAREGDAVFIPCGPELPPEKLIPYLAPLLAGNNSCLVCHDGKSLMHRLARHGVRPAGPIFDVMIAGYLLDATRRDYSLADLAARHLGGMSIGEYAPKEKQLELLPAANADDACREADVLLRLHPVLAKALDEAGHASLFRDLEMPLVRILADMEETGIALDKTVLTDLAAAARKKLAGMEAEIHKLAGREFNLASPKQLAEVLFTELKLPVVRKIKTGFSTDSDTLEELAALHPLPARLIEHRQLQKLLTTYLEPLPDLVTADGRIHTSFHQTATATGRLSSSDPNLQNIPVRTEEGRLIRKAFVAPDEHHVLLSADYNQIELRVLAHFSEDPEMLAAYHAGKDIHAFVAAQVNGVAEGDVTPEMRRRAKAVNFGIVYGLTPFGLSKDLRIPMNEAKRFIDAYFARYRGVKSYIDAVVEKAGKDGFVATMLGRRRILPGINSRNPQEKAFAERTAVNTVIQGTAADLIKKAMIAVAGMLAAEKHPARLLLQIHDELLFEVPRGGVAAVTKLVREAMTGVAELRVPLAVSMGTGPNWMEVK